MNIVLAKTMAIYDRWQSSSTIIDREFESLYLPLRDFASAEGLAEYVRPYIEKDKVLIYEAAV